MVAVRVAVKKWLLLLENQFSRVHLSCIGGSGIGVSIKDAQYESNFGLPAS